MKNKLKKSLYMVIVLLILLAGYSIYYFNDYYHADESSLSLINQTENVSLIKTDNGLLLDGPGNDTALIFYPGAKIEYKAYIPLFLNISQNNIDCFIVEMPLNFAFLGTDKADEIITNYNYTNWYMSGHSLGGVAASSYTNKHSDKIKGLIFLASYPTEKLENTSVLSIYGSNDKVLNRENYEKSNEYISSDYTEYVINGGNHAQFASYGNQSGDGIATITSEYQKNLTDNKILEFINS